ncbi:uncharacterized protein LOC125687372 [Lagopus muta]|uniref:uncharacterized protein LOC125687372 n=1 Tax=Lagopus muta TaxID=64668 RepID=UPI0020A0F5AB|nr:uncharacterized protein LOC125687372 [Lagopus muta]
MSPRTNPSFTERRRSRPAERGQGSARDAHSQALVNCNPDLGGESPRLLEQRRPRSGQKRRAAAAPRSFYCQHCMPAAGPPAGTQAVEAAGPRPRKRRRTARSRRQVGAATTRPARAGSRRPAGQSLPPRSGGRSPGGFFVSQLLFAASPFVGDGSARGPARWEPPRHPGARERRAPGAALPFHASPVAVSVQQEVRVMAPEWEPCEAPRRQRSARGSGWVEAGCWLSICGSGCVEGGSWLRGCGGGDRWAP